MHDQYRFLSSMVPGVMVETGLVWKRVMDKGYGKGATVILLCPDDPGSGGMVGPTFPVDGASLA